jgi:hypothetical protein
MAMFVVLVHLLRSKHTKTVIEKSSEGSFFEELLHRLKNPFKKLATSL